MSQVVQTGSIAFKPRARLLKLIGAELISDEVLAITELAKNAHDADASTVTIECHGVTRPDGCIVIRDDGHGMDLDILLGNWMEPAGTSKSSSGRRVTERGRRVLGEKGVGRFAADKLARELELISRRPGQATEVRAVFNWDEFDSDTVMLSEVKNAWEIRSASEIPRTGTILRMRGLRTTWNERMFRRLSTRLARLRSPFADRDGFAIRIESDEFPQYSGELRSDILKRALYRIDAVFDGEQTIDINLNGSRSSGHLWNGHGDLRCGPVRVRLFAFDLETEAIARIGPRMEVRAWLKEWSGVSLYRDGFRVWPYGEPHDDWLRLDQRRVNNPVTRLSNNQVVGFVEITRDRNPELADQTNREGLLQSRALDDLRRLLHFVFQNLEASRQAVRHPQVVRHGGGSKPPIVDSEAIPGELEALAKTAPRRIAVDLRRIAGRVRERMVRDDTQRHMLIDGYSELAAAGQAAIGLSATMQPMIEQLRSQLESIGRAVGRKGETVTALLDEARTAARCVAERISIIAPIEQGGRYRRRAMHVPAELERFRDLVVPMLAQRGVRMSVRVPRRGVLRVEMRPESLHRILHILTTNSLDWLDGVKKPEISVRAAARGERCELIFTDNGPGIPLALTQRVFDPLFSGREGGRGMGLTIATNIVSLHGGSIEVIRDRPHRGAGIRILLPRKRSRATIHTN